MSYFKKFSYIDYDYTLKGELPRKEVIVDLMQRVQLNISKNDLNVLCDEYIVGPHMTPELIAYKLYNDPLLHWTILYVNDITDIHAEWPLSDQDLFSFVTKKYGSGNEYNVHHYEKMPERLVIDADFCVSVYNETPRTVTNFDYESEKNELKHHIKVIKPEHISNFVQTFQNALING